MIKYDVKHYHQPSNYSCSQAALATLFSHYHRNLTPEEIIERVPVEKDEHGNDWGTLNQELATWCLSQGFAVTLHTADFQIIDLSWASLSPTAMVERMEHVKAVRNVPALGKALSKRYTQSYIDFVHAGGELHIEPYMSSRLLDTLLIRGPLIVAVSSNVLNNRGRQKNVGLRESISDDLHGEMATHSLVVYGRGDDGRYMIADPWDRPGFRELGPEHLLAAMTASQIECDNLLFQLAEK